MFKKVLIANRGEIAVRIIRACRELGISPVALHSDVDYRALHVLMADEAYEIGPAAAVESYLQIDRIIEVAKHSGADAIHPGYGFLSENPQFAATVASSGMVFIGPSSKTIESLGNKTQARQIAESLGVPIVPGMVRPAADFSELQAAVKKTGLPVMLKPAAGGGGKGMHLVTRNEELQAAFRLAQAEAASSFGDPRLYAERVIARPRHIEIQVLGDQYGEIVHLGERECSIQRRHQKLIEECPSPINDQSLRRQMGEAAIRIAKAASYVNAGTVEFLVDEARRFYFLEVNTRLQVEHPVTEWVTGVDLVQSQIRVAAGERLGFSQPEITWRGAAIECRIFAENPDEEFTPTPGRIQHLQYPGGPGVRVDSGIYPGYLVPVDYDPMLAKLTVWARDRAHALARMERALSEFTISGIKTPIELFRRIMKDGRFCRGDVDTGYLLDFLHTTRAESPVRPPPALSDEELAALAAALRHRGSPMPESNQALHASDGASNWKREARQAALRENG